MFGFEGMDPQVKTKEMEEIPVDKEIKIQKIKKKLVASFFYLF